MNEKMSLALWQRLSEAGLVEGEMPAAQPVERSPWYVRLMLGIAGWIASLFLMAAIGITFSGLFDEEVMLLSFGLIGCVSSYLLFRGRSDNDFVTQIGVAICMCGQLMVTFALFEIFNWREQQIFWFLALLGAVIALVMPNYLIRVQGAFMAAGSLIAASWDAGFGYTMQGVLLAVSICIAGRYWLGLNSLLRTDQVWSPFGYGVVFALILSNTYLMAGHHWWIDWVEPGLLASYSDYNIGLLVTLAVVLGLVFRLVRLYSVHIGGSERLLILVALIILLGMIWLIPATALGWMLLMVGFAAASRTMVGVGIVTLLGFLSHYYYSLEFTLLYKSVLLVVTGLVLLTGRWFIGKWLPVSGGSHD